MEPSPSMNGKSYEGLTPDGMAAHIANAIFLKNKKVGTTNDCKLVIAHVVRTYQRLSGTTQVEIPYTEAARIAEMNGEEIELEHAIPVGCLMNVLFHHASGATLEEFTLRVKQLLADNTILTWVTPAQHGELNKKYQSSMPAGYDTYPWKDVWARYLASGVQLPEGVSAPESLESRRRSNGLS